MAMRRIRAVAYQLAGVNGGTRRYAVAQRLSHNQGKLAAHAKAVDADLPFPRRRVAVGNRQRRPDVAFDLLRGEALEGGHDLFATVRVGKVERSLEAVAIIEVRREDIIAPGGATPRVIVQLFAHAQAIHQLNDDRKRPRSIRM